MKSLDRYLRDVRVAKASPFVRQGDVVVDIGCGDGALFRALSGRMARGIGVDPMLDRPESGDDFVLLPGRFPEALPADTKCDVITMLAVLEHLPPVAQATLSAAFDELLNPGGRIVITVPSPRVDQILHVLLKLRLIDGIAVHEHYGFKPSDTPAIFPPPTYRGLVARRFQLGLNNLFVFEKVAEEPGAS